MLKKELAVLIGGIASSVSSLVWLGILLGILIYTTSICFIQFIGEADMYPQDEFDNKFYFGDMVSALVTTLNLALLVG